MSIIKLRNIIFILICCDICYFLFPFKPAVIRFLILIFCGLVIFKYNPYKMDGFQKACVGIMVLNIIYYIFSIVSGDNPYFLLINTLVSLSGLLAFSVLGRLGALDEKFLYRGMFALMMACIFYFIHSRNVIVSKYDQDVTMNASSLFLWLIPMILIFRKKIPTMLVLGVSVYFLILASKRSNIIAAIPTLFIYFRSIIFNKQIKSRLKVSLFIGVVALVMFAYHWIISNEYFLYRVDQTIEGNSSNRDILYEGFWNMWLNSDTIWHMLFGVGYNGANNSYLQSMAHCDWLEYLIDYGIIGVICYSAFIVGIIRYLVRSQNMEAKLLFISILFILLIKSVFSMCILDDLMIIISIPVGCAIQYYYNSDEITTYEKQI